jgi:dethiobiotin synthase
MRHHFFITGTDTGVGKTVLSALLCAALDAVYWKPIQTGTLEGSDRLTVMRLAGIGSDRTLDEVYKFVPPVAPDLAARWAGVEIDLARIALPNHLTNDWLVVEGAGGVLVPINQKQFILDMAVKLKLPVILAARSTLGTINHTLLTLEALGRRGLHVAGVVMVGERNAENRAAIERYGDAVVIGEMPLFSPLDAARLAAWAAAELDPQRRLLEWLQ